MLVSDYFQPLMNRFRSHIAQLMVALLICSGLSLSWVQPVQADQPSHAFARWLSMMAKPADASDLQKELQELRASGGQLEEVLQKASQIVTQNNEEFNFPFSKEKASGQLYQLLLIEWNQYQTGNAMANVPVSHNVKPLLPLHIDKMEGATLATQGQPLFSAYVSSRWFSQPTSQDISFSIEPMSSGIAIGAP